jgi:hypothetical protein
LKGLGLRRSRKFSGSRTPLRFSRSTLMRTPLKPKAKYAIALLTDKESETRVLELRSRLLLLAARIPLLVRKNVSALMHPRGECI